MTAINRDLLAVVTFAVTASPHAPACFAREPGLTFALLWKITHCVMLLHMLIN